MAVKSMETAVESMETEVESMEMVKMAPGHFPVPAGCRNSAVELF
jgi:hypothetical protein